MNMNMQYIFGVQQGRNHVFFSPWELPGEKIPGIFKIGGNYRGFLICISIYGSEFHNCSQMLRANLSDSAIDVGKILPGCFTIQLFRGLLRPIGACQTTPKRFLTSSDSKQTLRNTFWAIWTDLWHAIPSQKSGILAGSGWWQASQNDQLDPS